MKSKIKLHTAYTGISFLLFFISTSTFASEQFIGTFSGTSTNTFSGCPTNGQFTGTCSASITQQSEGVFALNGSDSATFNGTTVTIEGINTPSSETVLNGTKGTISGGLGVFTSFTFDGYRG